jgi:hypothetical protein
MKVRVFSGKTNWPALEGVDHVINLPTLFIGAVEDVFVSPQRPEDVNKLIIDWLMSKNSQLLIRRR